MTNQQIFNAGYRVGFWKGFLWFQLKERKRHLADVKKIEDDIERLKAMGICVASEPMGDEWIEVGTDPMEL